MPDQPEATSDNEPTTPLDPEMWADPLMQAAWAVFLRELDAQADAYGDEVVRTIAENQQGLEAS